MTSFRNKSGQKTGSGLANSSDPTPNPSGGPFVNDAPVPVQEANNRLWTLEEISHLVSRRGSPSETLTNIVNLIQRRFATDVCSVYLLEPDRATLVLAATIGLRS